MILTTSRKPSKKTRRLAKVLARFMNWRYVNRGKMNLEELLSMGRLAVIEEIKGNPAILKLYDGREILRIRFNVSNINKVKMDRSPVVFVGKPPFDPLLLEAIPQTRAGMKFSRKIDAKKRVFVRRKDSGLFLIFTYGNVELFKMRMLETGV
ncbi:rRNA maturation protein [Archaeoglobales archaeon]|nr:MAG: rRNA maturation protein [Archaeoglobales archaeon]